MPLDRPDSSETLYEGGCHCQAVRFQVRPGDRRVYDCNCSICTKKGFLHLIVPPERFRLLRGGDRLSEYAFNTGTARHLFCRTCGIHSFYRPRSHPDCFDVNLRCLDGVDLGEFEIVPFDGREWEANVDRLGDRETPS